MALFPHTLAFAVAASAIGLVMIAPNMTYPTKDAVPAQPGAAEN